MCTAAAYPLGTLVATAAVGIPHVRPSGEHSMEECDRIGSRCVHCGNAVVTAECRMPRLAGQRLGWA